MGTHLSLRFRWGTGVFLGGRRPRLPLYPRGARGRTPRTNSCGGRIFRFGHRLDRLHLPAESEELRAQRESFLPLSFPRRRESLLSLRYRWGSIVIVGGNSAGDSSSFCLEPWGMMIGNTTVISRWGYPFTSILIGSLVCCRQ